MRITLGQGRVKKLVPPWPPSVEMFPFPFLPTPAPWEAWVSLGSRKADGFSGREAGPRSGELGTCPHPACCPWPSAAPAPGRPLRVLLCPISVWGLSSPHSWLLMVESPSLQHGGCRRGQVRNRQTWGGHVDKGL